MVIHDHEILEGCLPKDLIRCFLDFHPQRPGFARTGPGAPVPIPDTVRNNRGSFHHPKDVHDPDVPGTPGQLEPAPGPPDAPDETRRFQPVEELYQVEARDLLPF